MRTSRGNENALDMAKGDERREGGHRTISRDESSCASAYYRGSRGISNPWNSLQPIGHLIQFLRGETDSHEEKTTPLLHVTGLCKVADCAISVRMCRFEK
jgi:hypothetical protein